MANPFFEPPATPAGTTEEQLRAVYGYLYQMSTKLNESLNAVTIEQLDAEAQATIRTAAGAEEKTKGDFQALKSLIIKTAEVVTSEMDAIRTVLTGQYEAISEQFGTYEETLTTTITDTAEGYLRQMNYDRMIEAADSFRQESEHYIFMGLLEAATQEHGDIVGIAIGDGVRNDQGQLVNENKYATFTSQELAFYVNGVKTAWFSNSTMFIDRAQLMTSLQMGNHEWRVLAGGSMALINNKQTPTV